jgi:hypothetical protein
MNLNKMLHELHEDKQRLEKVIRSLEELQENSVDGQSSIGRKRGRKSMPAEERREVSARMKKYWASRRNQKAKVAAA